MMKSTKTYQQVAVLMGGISAERDISLRSGSAAVAGLEACGYDVSEIVLQSEDVVLPEGIEAVFIALHGTFGEDGTVQAFLQHAGVPFTGSGAKASRLAMDKCASKDIWLKEGISTAPYCVCRKGEAVDFDFPAVVKPVSQGSSIGVHLVQGKDALPAALADALQYDSRVMVERYIPGRELTVGILGEEALPVVEIVAPDGWYGFGAKYSKGQTQYEVPAALSELEVGVLQEMALAAFTSLGCCGFGRVDFRLTPDGIPMVLEVNTIPGLTETSLLPKAAASAGISFADLCGRIMETAGLAAGQEKLDG
jgi:D-alanine-D-alanine ligase